MVGEVILFGLAGLFWILGVARLCICAKASRSIDIVTMLFFQSALVAVCGGVLAYYLHCILLHFDAARDALRSFN